MKQNHDLIALLALDDRGRKMCPNRSRFANTPTILRQVDMALALGCKTLILLVADPSDSDALATQHLAEANEMRFHLLTRPQQLPNLLTDRSELVLIAPGVMAGDAVVLEEMLGSEGLLAIPAESPDGQGLERLDLHSAWGGALRMPVELVVQIEMLGNECELLSALPRIARSSGVTERPIPDEILQSRRWTMDGTKADEPATAPVWRDIRNSIVAPLASIFAEKNWPVFIPAAAALLLIVISAIAVWFELLAIAVAVLAVSMLTMLLQVLISAQAEPLRLTGSAAPLWAGFAPMLPEIVAAFVTGMALSQKASFVPSAYAAAALLGAGWLSRRTVTAEYNGLTSGPLAWLVIACFGAVGHWWAGVALLTAFAFGAIALELRGLRRITTS